MKTKDNGSHVNSGWHQYFTPLLAISALAFGGYAHGHGHEKNKAGEKNFATKKIDWSDKGWELVWQDEFNESNLDYTKWNKVTNCWGGGNNEQQCYVDKSDNFEFENGALHIVARKEDYTGSAERVGSPGYSPENTRTLPYTSGRIRSNNKGDWKYGRIEARIRLPHGQGTWPAFWMLPTDEEYGGWAASGEIDIMEAVNIGAKTDKTGKLSDEPEIRVHGTLHYGLQWPNNAHKGADFALPGGFNPSTNYHTYAIEWEEGEIRWYMDDIHYATQTSETWFSGYKNEDGETVMNPGHAPFDKRFHLIINLAIGGDWVSNVNEKGINPDIFPQRLSIDYVRVYQCSKDPETGKGCASVSDEAQLISSKY
jgi:beta-glucanase (GH16 family)